MVIATLGLAGKGNINDKHTSLGLFPLLFWPFGGLESVRGKNRKCWKGLEGSIPAISSEVNSSAPYKSVGPLSFHVTFEVGG